MSERFNGTDEATEFMKQVERLIDGDGDLSTYLLWDELRDTLTTAEREGYVRGYREARDTYK